MGWFQKKKSPVDRRLDELNNQIAELEAQVRRQHEEELRRAAEAITPPPTDEQTNEPAPSAPTEATPPKQADKPRFRTTVNPRGGSPVHGIEPHEVDFFARRDKPVDFSLEGGQAPSAKSADAKKSASAPAEPKGQGFLNELLNLFGKPRPRPQQERLAGYLSTGSFQRLKPLRYEKRVARTRLIILLLIVGVIVFLIIRFVMK